MTRMFIWLLILLCTHSHAYLNQPLRIGVQAVPSLMALMPLYFLYKQCHEIEAEPVQNLCEQRIKKIIDRSKLTEPISIKKLSSTRDILPQAELFTPIARSHNQVLALGISDTLYVNERLCMRMSEEELTRQLLPCMIGIQKKVTRQAISNALTTPVVSDLTSKIVTFVVHRVIEALCAELVIKKPLLGAVVCASQSLIDSLLTSAIIKFILNNKLMAYLTQKQREEIAQEAARIIKKTYEYHLPLTAT